LSNAFVPCRKKASRIPGDRRRREGIAKPYTNARYFQRSTDELKEDFCEDRVATC